MRDIFVFFKSFAVRLASKFAKGTIITLLYYIYISVKTNLIRVSKYSSLRKFQQVLLKNFRPVTFVGYAFWTICPRIRKLGVISFMIVNDDI
jgi:hypothetical protein